MLNSSMSPKKRILRIVVTARADRRSSREGENRVITNGGVSHAINVKGHRAALFCDCNVMVVGVGDRAGPDNVRHSNFC